MIMINKKYKAILCIGIAVLVILCLFYWDEIMLPKYEYKPGTYSLSGEITIEGIIYKEINEETYENIYNEMEKKGIEPHENVVIGRIGYTFVDKIWKFKIYGNRSLEDRILLKGEEDYLFNDANYPKIYFCRQDITELLNIKAK